MAALAQREAIALRIDTLLGDVDTLLNHLDRLDGDTDLEPNGDELDCGWTEPGGRQLGQAWTVDNEDAEEDDFREDDDDDSAVDDRPCDDEGEAEREQSPDDVPCPPVYALEPDPADGKRRHLGRNCSNPDAFVGNRDVVRFA